jgi:hypothetical protein
MGEAARKRRRATRDFYHVTTPEIAAVILAEGFRDHAASKGVPGIPDHRPPPRARKTAAVRGSSERLSSPQLEILHECHSLTDRR